MKIQRNNTTTFSVSCSPTELERINARVRSLGLDRSAYILALARRDYQRRAGEFVLLPLELEPAQLQAAEGPSESASVPEFSLETPLSAPWSDPDTERLISLVSQKVTLAEMCKQLQRTALEIAQHAHNKLGIM